LSGLQCRVFSLVPSDEPNRVPADQNLTLLHSWERNKTCSLNDTGVTYFSDKSSLLYKSKINVFAREVVLPAWRPFMHFLEFAMNASFNINTPFEKFTVLKNVGYPPQLQVGYLRVQDVTVPYYTFSSYIENGQKTSEM